VSAPRRIITVRDLSKAYSIYERPRDVLRETLFGGVRHDLFWALKNVSFDVFEGDRVGIIGPNGAGKSTLLQLVTGNLTPTSGSVTVNGRVSAMLSLTSFLDPNETGLENIRFNLLLNGVDRRDVPRLSEQVVEFAELGGFVHAPVRTYSTGMNARLAFSIATVITPDILVVDEVLGVGDAYFSAKAMQRMVELCNEGRALLFVTHAMLAIQRICNKAIWIDTGGVRAIGPVDEILKAYEDEFLREEDESVRAGHIRRRGERASRVRAEEIGAPGTARLRLIGESGRIIDTHYVRALSLESERGEAEISLYTDTLGRPDALGALDLVHSEWGRLHSRKGSESRVLEASPRLLRGGHLLVRAPESGSSALRLVVESTSLGLEERLKLQVADLASGEWLDVASTLVEPLRGDWTRTTFAGTIGEHSADLDAETLQRILEESRPDVEITKVAVHVAGERTAVVRERDPFELVVSVCARRPVPRADVMVKIVRADGTYIFWQSSGQVGQELVDVTGDFDVVFRVDPNLFGAGEYEVTIDVGNGYDVQENFPHSLIYDRRVNAARFTVHREWQALMLGPVNHRFAVEIHRTAPAEGDERERLSTTF
jgi:lipopolysaccharide transport system ATP-binding protein